MKREDDSQSMRPLDTKRQPSTGMIVDRENGVFRNPVQNDQFKLRKNRIQVLMKTVLFSIF